ncbi:BTAD domain-containing putative transcriptional regulator [Amycolatopsis sp. NPDC021455]|uniref:AfsR/SARP family transcriptional regulator n=1 Tax=Amycolatopsis sp. NPDC021455 TaxID=3154901 RepID=UPI0033DE3A18
MIEFGVLGEFRVLADGTGIDVGPARQRAVLAALVMDLNRVVPAELLVERVWGDRPPSRARATLHSYLSRLRGALSPATDVVIDRRSPGYVLIADENTADVHRFRSLARQASGAGGEDRLAVLRRALELWRGEALTDVDTPWAQGERFRLDQERRAAELEYTELRLARGQHAELVPELAARSAEHPDDERVAGQLMTALYRCGRQAEALDRYEQLRIRLRRELGADPSPSLGRLHQRILNAELEPAADRPPRGRVPVPHQLAARPRGFVGRVPELAHLTGALTGDGDPAAPMAISVISGPGGIGKTWLALRWAHQSVESFPDGQLQICLRGFDTPRQPLQPATALRAFLTALGVAPEAIPDDVDTQAALYRSLLAGKRMLVVLDDARDAAQVRPLLPGTGSCAVLITSRRRFTDLAGSHGAQVLNLDVLSDGECRELLAHRLGPGRLTAEPRAVAELLGHCRGVPLTLGIVAARATAQADLPLDVVVSELREATSADHDAPADDVLAANLRSVISSSCVTLPPDVATLFALLSLAPGPGVSLAAAASLAALPGPRARAQLRELREANLVLQPAEDRYRMHDLIKVVSAERARHDVPGPVRTTAERRVVDCYLYTAAAGQSLLNPHRPAVALGAPAGGCTVGAAPDPATAVAWFEAESDCLLATQDLAVRRGWDRIVWQLAWVLTPFQRWTGNHYDNIVVWRHGLAATERLGDPALRARAHRWLGHAYARAGEYGQGLGHLRQACALAEETGDPVDLAYSQHTVSLIWGWQGENARAIASAGRAVALFEVLGNPIWLAEALNTLGWYEGCVGHYAEARAHCARALALDERHAYPDGQAHALDSLGSIAHRSGRHREALDYYHRSLVLRRELGDAYGVATTLAGLGNVHSSLGQDTQARETWLQARDLHIARGCLAEARDIQRSLSLGGPVHA